MSAASQVDPSCFHSRRTPLVVGSMCLSRRGRWRLQTSVPPCWKAACMHTQPQPCSHGYETMRHQSSAPKRNLPIWMNWKPILTLPFTCSIPLDLPAAFVNCGGSYYWTTVHSTPWSTPAPGLVLPFGIIELIRMLVGARPGFAQNHDCLGVVLVRCSAGQFGGT